MWTSMQACSPTRSTKGPPWKRCRRLVKKKILVLTACLLPSRFWSEVKGIKAPGFGGFISTLGLQNLVGSEKKWVKKMLRASFQGMKSSCPVCWHTVPKPW